MLGREQNVARGQSVDSASRTRAVRPSVTGKHAASDGVGVRSMSRVPYTLALFSAVVILSVGLSFVVTSDGAIRAPAVAAATQATCPGGVSQCISVTIPIQCGSTTCPATVVAGPTTNVGDGQYVYLDMTDFPAGDKVRIAYCPTTNPPSIPTGGDPQCAYGVDAQDVTLTSVVVPVDSSGQVSASFPTQIDASGQGNSPIGASPIISNDDPKVPFFCDNGPDYCALEVEDLPGGDTGQTETSSNTALIPLSFAAQSSGCPAKDPLVYTDSAFSLEHFLPAAIDSTCTQGAGVADLNTATETGQAIQDFASGGVAIAFTDEPQDPAESEALKDVHYEYIPIAVSATVVGFLGGDFVGVDEPAAPVATYNLTPNMVAGLVTINYGEPYASDIVMPPLVCSEIWECGKQTSADNYDTFDLLNPTPTGVVGPQSFGAFFSSTESGASYQVTNWMCSAPNVPFDVTVPLKVDNKPVPTEVPVLDPNTATSTLTAPQSGNIVWPPSNLPPGDPIPPWPFTKCQPYSTLPVLAGQVTQYSFAETPALQANAMRGFAEANDGVESNHTLMGFGAMDWSEASYFGLDSASLQNAAGNFVAPSETSIDAALDDATQSSDGVLQYNYDDSSDADAYPMPMVTYALVSTSAESPASDQAEGDLLTNLVCYSHSGGSISLPTGYVPLPDNLYSKALAEIGQTFPYAEKSCDGTNPTLPASTKKSPPGSHKNGGQTTPTSQVGQSGDSGSGSSSASGPVGETTTVSSQLASKTGTTLPPRSSASRGHNASSTEPASPKKGLGRGFEPVILAAAEGAERWIVVALVIGALSALIVGPVILLTPAALRRFRRLRKSSAA